MCPLAFLSIFTSSFKKINFIFISYSQYLILIKCITVLLGVNMECFATFNYIATLICIEVCNLMAA